MGWNRPLFDLMNKYLSIIPRTRVGYETVTVNDQRGIKRQIAHTNPI